MFDSSGPKFPHVKVKLVGNDGNAFAILGSVKNAMRKAKVPSEDVSAFMKEAMSGDYNHLLATCTEWVDVS